MDAKSVNKQLRELYDKWLNDSLANTYDIKEYTYPVLMRCNSKYCNSKTKILFIENETKEWLSDKDCYETPYMGKVVFNIDSLMNLYEDYNSKFSIKTKTTKVFEKIMLHITDEINAEFDCLWTSVSKVERKSSNYPTRKEFHYCEDINISILVREIECINPDAIVFVTGTSNYNDIATIRYIFGKDSLFIPVEADEQLTIITKRGINKLVVRVPDPPRNVSSMYHTISSLIKNNKNAYKYQTV